MRFWVRWFVWERFDLGQACSQDRSDVLSLLDCGRRCRCAVESLPGQEPQGAWPCAQVTSDEMFHDDIGRPCRERTDQSVGGSAPVGQYSFLAG